MHKIEIPEINFIKEVPSNIEELSEEQYLFFIEQVVLWQQNLINVNDFRIRLILHFLDIKITASYKRMSEDDRMIIDSNIYRMSNLIDSFFIDKENEKKVKQKVLNLYSIRNFLPEIKINKIKLYGPDNALSNISFIEYIHATEHFRNYLENNDAAALNKLCAVLYRPEIYDYNAARLAPDFNGQRRIKYNQNTVDDRAILFEQTPFYIKYAILQFFANCEEFFRSGELNIGGNIIYLDTLYKQNKEKQDYTERKDDLGWISILYAIAESNVFGNTEQTSEQNFYDILLYLYKTKKDLEALKLKSK